MEDYRPDTSLDYTAFKLDDITQKDNYSRKYFKDLETGKRATILCQETYPCDECIIEITEEDRKVIINSDEVCLNDYDCDFDEDYDGSGIEITLKDADSFSKEE